MRYHGRVFRPPSEAYSLIVQATIGCSHNQCAFCSMYKEKKFQIRKLEEVLADLDEARATYGQIERIFLADGDALILPQEHLVAILRHIRQIMPECKRVGIYSSPRSIKTKTVEQLAELHDEGLGIAYLGLESGCEEILKRVNKGETVEEIVAAGLKVKEAGLTLSVTAINGLGGREMTQQHALDTAAALSRIKPHFIALLTLRVYSDTPLQQWVDEGSLTLMEPIELARETRMLLEKLDSEGSVFRSNHASNYLPLAGNLNEEKAALLAKLDRALEGKARFRSKVELGF